MSSEINNSECELNNDLSSGISDMNSEIDKLASVYGEIARRFGYDVAVKMHNHFQGQQVSFPVRLYDAKYTAKSIRREYQKGESIRNLSVKYGYSERRIRQIVSGI